MRGLKIDPKMQKNPKNPKNPYFYDTEGSYLMVFSEIGILSISIRIDMSRPWSGSKMAFLALLCQK